MHHVLIVGGGFGGVKLAQELGKAREPGLKVTLVDPKLFMEYHAAMYRFVTGRSPAEICLPYSDLLKGTGTEHARDSIQSIDLDARTARGTSGAQYHYDSLVLAVGGEANTFGLQGLEKYAIAMRSVEDALRLKRHLHTSFETAKEAKPEDQKHILHIAIVGGGPTGVELASEIQSYAQVLGKKHGVDPALVTIDLIESSGRVLPSFPEKFASRVERRLHDLHVNLFLKRTVVKQLNDELFLDDLIIRAKTVIWTAGVKGHRLLSGIAGLPTDPKGRVRVSPSLGVPDHPEVFAIGDAAATQYSGMAQTALADATHVSSAILSLARGQEIPSYKQPSPSYAVPVGRHWAAVSYHGYWFFGRLGWLLRRAADLRAFLTLLPPAKAFRAFRGGDSSLEVCEVCTRAR